MNADLRKIPINWYVYPTDEAVAAKEDPRDDTVETLSYAAASIADRHLKDDVRLKAMRERSQHPFTSFIESKNFSRVNAISLLCSGNDKAEIQSLYSIKCAANATPDEDVRGQVVIIGDDVPGKDRHELFDQDVSGLYLQANYIESLLDDRYLQPVGTGAKLPVGTAGNVIFLVAWFAVLYLLFWFVFPEIALVISVLIGAIAWYSAKQLAPFERTLFRSACPCDRSAGSGGEVCGRARAHGWRNASRSMAAACEVGRNEE
jgi:CHASE2 domain-containing sensor protein